MNDEPITWLTAQEVAEDPDLPLWPSSASAYLDARNKRIPHYRRGQRTGHRVRFPKQVIQRWLQGEPIAEHWLEGKLAPPIPSGTAA